MRSWVNLAIPGHQFLQVTKFGRCVMGVSGLRQFLL